VIDRAIRRVEREYPSISIVRNYSPDVPRMGVDPELMEQVFFNLLTNAAQASSPPAGITVRTREIGGNAEISIIDRGCGIPRDLMETMFNPFVTTKRDGVGLGLAIVAKIVDEHGGRMAVESEPGKGSTFRVFLPIQK
jgi:signal transduction histidine kinase